jgi:hypothetical protein
MTTLTIDLTKVNGNTKVIDIQGKTWRVNGKVKTWKRQPERFQIPVKYGLYVYGYITEKNINEIAGINY